MTDTLHRILPQVQKPARYVGGEYNQIVKDKRDVDVRVAFCFPDTYEIGMSNIGMRILYGLMNELPGVWCERVFAPWGDMEEKMREHAIPLYALESASCRTWMRRISRQRRSFRRRKLSTTGRIWSFSAAASAAAGSVRQDSATARCARKAWTRSAGRRSSRWRTPATAR